MGSVEREYTDPDTGEIKPKFDFSLAQRINFSATMTEELRRSVIFSKLKSGEIVDKPDNSMGVVVKDGEGNASGVLQKWASREWIYADCDAFIDKN